MHNIFRHVARLLVALTIAASLSGCTMFSSGRHYSAARLPLEYAAAHVQNPRLLDLSQFTGPPFEDGLIDRGDVLNVAVAAGLDEGTFVEFPARVADDGTIIVPQIGPILVAGLTVMQAEQQLTATCIQQNLYRRPNITITIDQPRVNRITVVGAVEEPGEQELSRHNSYLTPALVSAGGMTTTAGTVVRIRRPTGVSALASSGGVRQVNAMEGPSTLLCLNLSDPNDAIRAAEYLPDGTVITVDLLEPEPVQMIGLVGAGDVVFPRNRDLTLLGAVGLAVGV